MGMVAAVLLAVPLLLTLQFAALSNRPDVPLDRALEASLYPANLASMAVANVMGSLRVDLRLLGTELRHAARGRRHRPFVQLPLRRCRHDHRAAVVRRRRRRAAAARPARADRRAARSPCYTCSAATRRYTRSSSTTCPASTCSAAQSTGPSCSWRCLPSSRATCWRTTCARAARGCRLAHRHHRGRCAGDRGVGGGVLGEIASGLELFPASAQACCRSPCW